MIDQVVEKIKNLRRNPTDQDAAATFKSFVEDHIDQICDEASTRWLVSICDTFADFGSDIEARNAMIITTMVNTLKLCETYRFMVKDSEIDPQKRDQLCLTGPVRIHNLWDGMTSFHLKVGDMAQNMMKRHKKLLEATPAIEKIWDTVITRMVNNPTIIHVLRSEHPTMLDYNVMREK